MASKKQPSSKKVLDISRPKRTAAASTTPTAPQLVIPKRSVIVPVADASSDDNPAAPDLIPTKRVARNIAPTTAPEVTVPAPDQASDPTPTAPKTEEQSAPASSAPNESPAAEPQPEAPAAPAPQETEQAAEAEDKQETPEPETDTADVTNEAGSKGKADPNIKKALEEAKREEEVQGYIDKREFFVPINAVARRRNIKVTIALVFLELVLGLFLLNLMLDAGLIYLLEKVPHTHFFNLQ